ncbi:uncharacterized protein JCM15063_002938 [Sporobolomyces koalae]|uniref:uncharacterized protein n=1 Tax=Sporobolomyces koalae TaxID=500713 RepID=UPI00316ECA70
MQYSTRPGTGAVSSPSLVSGPPVGPSTLAPSRPPVGSVRSSTTTGITLASDPVIEARKHLALVRTHLDTLDLEANRLFQAYDHAYDDDQDDRTRVDVEQVVETIDTLVQLLSRSPLGGYPSSSTSNSSSSSSSNVEAVHKSVQSMFSHLKRSHEAIEIVTTSLSSSR